MTNDFLFFFFVSLFIASFFHFVPNMADGYESLAPEFRPSSFYISDSKDNGFGLIQHETGSGATDSVTIETFVDKKVLARLVAEFWALDERERVEFVQYVNQNKTDKDEYMFDFWSYMWIRPTKLVLSFISSRGRSAEYSYRVPKIPIYYFNDFVLALENVTTQDAFEVSQILDPNGEETKTPFNFDISGVAPSTDVGSLDLTDDSGSTRPTADSSSSTIPLSSIADAYSATTPKKTPLISSYGMMLSPITFRDPTSTTTTTSTSFSSSTMPSLLSRTMPSLPAPYPIVPLPSLPSTIPGFITKAFKPLREQIKEIDARPDLNSGEKEKMKRDAVRQATTFNLTLEDRTDPAVARILAEVEREKKRQEDAIALRNRINFIGVHDPFTGIITSQDEINNMYAGMGGYIGTGGARLDLPFDGVKPAYEQIHEEQQTDINRLNDLSETNRLAAQLFPKSVPVLAQPGEAHKLSLVSNALTSLANNNMNRWHSKERDTGIAFADIKQRKLDFERSNFYNGKPDVDERVPLQTDIVSDMLFS
jgi:hypothetical protein